MVVVAQQHPFQSWFFGVGQRRHFIERLDYDAERPAAPLHSPPVPTTEMRMPCNSSDIAVVRAARRAIMRALLPLTLRLTLKRLSIANPVLGTGVPRT